MISVVGPTPLAAGWIVCSLLWRLPGAYWLLGFCTVLILVPVQILVNAINHDASPELDRNRRFTVWNVVAIVFGGVVFVFALLGTFGPPVEVIAGNSMRQSDRALLVQSGIILEDENVEYFYSDGLISIKERGSVLTNQRVIAYGPNEEGEIEVYALYFDAVGSVELVEQGNVLNPSVYKVTSTSGDSWLFIVLSTENGGHLKFIKGLQGRIGSSTE